MRWASRDLAAAVVAVPAALHQLRHPVRSSPAKTGRLRNLLLLGAEVTSVPAVKAALKAVLVATLPDTQVIYGPISAVTTVTPRIATVGRVFDGRRDWDSMSNQTIAETYRVELVHSVSIPGTDQQEADELALADYEAAERAIREHAAGPTLGIVGMTVDVSTDGDFETAEQADENGRHVLVRWSVHVYAQNT